MKLVNPLSQNYAVLAVISNQPELVDEITNNDKELASALKKQAELNNEYKLVVAAVLFSKLGSGVNPTGMKFLTRKNKRFKNKSTLQHIIDTYFDRLEPVKDVVVNFNRGELTDYGFATIDSFYAFLDTLQEVWKGLVRIYYEETDGVYEVVIKFI